MANQFKQIPPEYPISSSKYLQISLLDSRKLNVTYYKHSLQLKTQSLGIRVLEKNKLSIHILVGKMATILLLKGNGP